MRVSMSPASCLLAISFSSLIGCTGFGNDGSKEAFASTSEALVTGPAFYVDGELYRTVGTPTDLPLSAPDHSFDII
jgi:hypothetical protein